MAFYNLDRTQIHRKYLVIRSQRRMRDAFVDYLEKAIQEGPQTEIIDYTVCRRCNVRCFHKKCIRRGGQDVD